MIMGHILATKPIVDHRLDHFSEKIHFFIFALFISLKEFQKYKHDQSAK